MRKRRRSIGVEEVIDVTDTSVLWNFILDFPSYELSNACAATGYKNLVRSFKSIHVYPFGNIIQPIKRSNPNDPSYELTDKNNNRVTIRLSQLIRMIKEQPFTVAGYPRHSNMVSATCRNERIFINKNLKVPQLDNTTRFYPKFDMVEDTNSVLRENPSLKYSPEVVSVPIESIDGTHNR